MKRGHPIVQTAFGYKATAVNQMLLSTILDKIDSPIFDLCDFDVQGREFDVIAEAIKILNSRVKRFHIGTHGHKIEQRLQDLLKSNDWELIRYYPCCQTNQTEYGSISFVDGVQSWRNKRFK